MCGNHAAPSSTAHRRIIAATARRLCGLCLLLWAEAQPVFRDAAPANRLCSRGCDGARRVPATGARHVARFTRHPAANLAVLPMASDATFATLFAGRRDTRAMASRCRTLPIPRTSRGFPTIGNGLLPGIAAATAIALDTVALRQQFVTCADSISIPMSGMFPSLRVSISLLSMLGPAVARGFGALPVSRLRRDRSRPLLSAVGDCPRRAADARPGGRSGVDCVHGRLARYARDVVGTSPAHAGPPSRLTWRNAARD